MAKNRAASDSIGERFGRLIVIGLSHRQRGRAYVSVKCDCGSDAKAIDLSNLRRGDTRSCGCLMPEGSHKAEDSVHAKFGKLTVLAIIGRKIHEPIVLCDCDCGEQVTTRLHDLRMGRVTSCGCSRIKHGLSRGSKVYRTWLNIHQRCKNPKHPSFKYYGGRGIVVTDKWNDFREFLKDVGQPPVQGSDRSISIDRIDNNGNYGPGNVRWATALEQARNTRKYKGSS